MVIRNTTLSLLLLILIIVSTPITSFSQPESRTGITSSPTKLSGNVYNKHTGTLLTESELKAILNKPKRPYFEKVINKYGEITKMWYDSLNTTDRGNFIDVFEKNQTPVGELLPDFVFRTVTGDTIASKDLSGKW